MSIGTPDDEELVRRFRAGARDALDLLVERYVRRAIAVAREYSADLDAAEDIVQDTWQRAVRGIARFDDRQRFAPWFFTIVRNSGRNEQRRVARLRPLDDVDLAAPQGASDAALRAEFARHVERVLAALPARQAGCFRLCEIEGFSASEVGEMMGLATPTVRVHAHRARLKLREALLRLGYEAPA